MLSNFRLEATVVDVIDRPQDPRRPHASSFDIFTRMDTRLFTHEGIVPYMYKDTAEDERRGIKGNVTVGVGFLLPTKNSVDEYAWHDRKTLRSVTKEVARAQWQNITDKAPAGLWPPSRYEKYTTIGLSYATIRTKFLEKLTEVHTMLWAEFAIVGFHTLPPSVQEGLFDLAWNTATEDFEREWPELTAAVKKRDWTEAARQSHRDSRNVSEDRNEETRQLFLQGVDFDRIP